MKLAPALVSLIVFAACASEPTPSLHSTEPSEPDDGLVLDIEQPDRVAGTYVDPILKLSLVFDAGRAGDALSLHLATGDNAPLVDIDTVGDVYRFSYLGGRLTMTVDQSWIEAVRAEGEDGPAAQDESALRWEGDMTVLDEMLAVPEVKVLAYMSRALGARGITGNAFPASLVIHKMARQSADALAVEIEPLPPSAGEQLFCSRPTANSCYGMCGPGCTCWSWVCGDCCYHGGCAKHDSWCRQGQWYYCYNITAVIALFGC
ncbi:MAG: hypothetical protein F9K40_11195 [Kofleriaceae bacterium]|nr:MAG: hypothetical protein F9K40_11195 [Kofleriaceae bacterium]MBZ0237290.1 hypothetical protein [Kofleriaceae bacterium]